jgi:ADP-ribose pyrophosphatase YjhB (NUDIX family)
MEIRSQYEYNGKTFNSHWIEDEPTHNLHPKGTNGDRVGGVHAICFCRDKIVMAYEEKKKRWGPLGGGIEKSETYEQAVVREIQEESNMKVLYQNYIGYIDVSDIEGNMVERQARVFCIVEPYGDFVSDPDQDITEIKLIDPKDYKQYFDWGEIGDRIMELAIGMKKDFDTKSHQPEGDGS